MLDKINGRSWTDWAYQPPQRRPMDIACHHLETRKYDKGNQQSDGETIWTNTGPTRSGRGHHKRDYGCPMMMMIIMNVDMRHGCLMTALPFQFLLWQVLLAHQEHIYNDMSTNYPVLRRDQAVFCPTVTVSYHKHE